MNQDPPAGSGARKANGLRTRARKNGSAETVRGDAEVGRDRGSHSLRLREDVRGTRSGLKKDSALGSYQEEEEEEIFVLRGAFSLEAF